MKLISATDLYSYVKCPHRVWRDAFDNEKLKDPPNEFIQLLWERGVTHERDVIAKQKGEIEILDLSGIPPEERFEKTLEAMRNRIPYIYQGYLTVDELVGKPDLLELQPTGEYMPIDIKSGMGTDGDEEEEDAKLKKGYAVQIGLYVDALIRLGFLKNNFGKILDSRAILVDYDLNTARGARNKQTWWEFYLEILGYVRAIHSKQTITEPALGSVCKLCEWQTDCKKQCIKVQCMSLVPELGRSRKESLIQLVKNMKDLAKMDIQQFSNAKTQFGIKGIGDKTFEKLNRRAKLLTSGQKDPVILTPFILPQKPLELFFDIEADPTQDIVYLHGVVERNNRTGKAEFRSFVARDVTKEEEARAWATFWSYIRSLPQDSWVMYYYSKYERTQYRLLAERYPDVATGAEVEWLYEQTRSIDLYFDIVYKCTDWPTYNYSVKTLAQHLGFKWRDENPSGAASIQWFNEWCQSKDGKILQRILDYNEDDCHAMIVVKDKLARMIR